MPMPARCISRLLFRQVFFHCSLAGERPTENPGATHAYCYQRDSTDIPTKHATLGLAREGEDIEKAWELHGSPGDSLKSVPFRVGQTTSALKARTFLLASPRSVILR